MVAEQQEPDRRFPTVAFPNPEEPGALELAIALAEAHHVDLVSPTTPTPIGGGRRPDPQRAGGCSTATRSGRSSATTCSPRASPATAAVHDRLVGVARQDRRRSRRGYGETLTGFKWVNRVPDLVFGYEEALGYSVDPEHVKDKDGVSALLLLCEIAAIQKARGRSLHGRARPHRHPPRPARRPAFLDPRLRPVADRGEPAWGRPAVLAQAAWPWSRSRTCPLGSADLPPTDGLRYRLAEGARVIVRPSGTEPKLKAYLEVVIPVRPDDGVDAARIAAAGRLDAIKGDVKAALGI